MERQERHERSINLVLERQNKILKAIFKLTEKVNSLSGGEVGESGAFLAIDNEEELDQLETSLNVEESVKDMIQRIRNIGGSDYKDAVKQTLSRLFTINFLCQCNLRGKNGKIAITEKKVFQIIVDAIARKYPAATEKDVRNQIAIKLKNAPDQKGGAGRQKANQPEGNV